MSKLGKKPFYKKLWVWIIAIIIIGVAIGSQNGKDKNSDTSAASTTDADAEQAQSQVKEEDTKINYDNFVSIKMGQSYNDIVTLLGEGTEESSSEVSGIKTSIYNWDSKGLATLDITIQNGVVTGKSQAGLKDMDANITLDKYNKINNGMTYEQVKEILGEGQVISQTKIMDIESTMYEYTNKDGSNASFTFNGNKLKSKAQLQLE